MLHSSDTVSSSALCMAKRRRYALKVPTRATAAGEMALVYGFCLGPSAKVAQHCQDLVSLPMPTAEI